MRYSKLFLVLMLTLILVFGGSMSAFAVDMDWLSLDVEPFNSWGTISGTTAGQYVDGTQISITAVPASGYSFDYWDVEIDGPSNDYTSTDINLIFNITKNTKCTAYFEKNYALNVTVHTSSTGMGVVSGSGSYPDDFMVPVTATPNDGYHFVKWIINIHDDGLPEMDLTPGQPSTFNFEMMKKTVDLMAVFEKSPELNITVNNPLMGSYSGSAEGSYTPGDPISIIPEPEEGYRLDHWMMGTTEKDPMDPITFMMPKDDVDIHLVFEAIPSFNLTTSIEYDDDWGTVEGAGTYMVGEQVDLEAIPARGYGFSHWEWTWECEQAVRTTEVIEIDTPLPMFDENDKTISFTMHECNGHFTAFFYALEETYGVRVIADPDEGGNPILENNPLPGHDGFDGYYYIGETFTIDPKPAPHWHFVGYDWECVPGPGDELARAMAVIVTPDYMSTNPDYIFEMSDCYKEITVYYEPSPFVLATLEYHNTVGGELRPDDTNIKVYLDEPYSFSPPAISGYQHVYSTPNAAGTLTEGATNFVVTFVYQVPPTPQVITNTVTETVVVTQTVTVPATTAPTTEAVIPDEGTPLGSAMIGFNFDEMLPYAGLPPVETEPTVVVPVVEVPLEETPLGEALPQTGQLPVELFYGIGGLVSAVGVFLKRRK